MAVAVPTLWVDYNDILAVAVPVLWVEYNDILAVAVPTLWVDYKDILAVAVPTLWVDYNEQDPREQQLPRNLENRNTETYKRSSFLREGEQPARNHIGQLSINGTPTGRNHLGLQTTA